MKYVGTLLVVLALCGCDHDRRNREVLIEERQKEQAKINVSGKLVDAPPAGVSEVMVLVEGRWMRAKDEGVTWHTRCGDGECKARLGPAPKKK